MSGLWLAAVLAAAAPEAKEAEVAATEAVQSPEWGIRLGVGPGIALSDTGRTSGFFFDLDAVRYLPVDKVRFALGVEGRMAFTSVATHLTVGAVMGGEVEATEVLSFPLWVSPGFTRIDFASPFFFDDRAFSLRMETGLLMRTKSGLQFGLLPFCFSTLFTTRSGALSIWEPRLTMAVRF